MSPVRFRFPWKTAAQIDAEVTEEFEFHVQSRADEMAAAGVPLTEARRRAEAEFGNAATARAYCRRVDLQQERTARRAEGWAGFRIDVVYLRRTLARTPGAAATIVAILGLALGFNLIVFTLANELLFKQLPVADPASLVLIHGETRQTHEALATSIADFHDLHRGVGALAGLAGFNGRFLGLATEGPAVAVPAQIVTANYFDVLGLAPALGRFFAAADDQPGTGVSAVISHQLWLDRFGASPAAIGSSLRLNGQPATIIGVAPRGFAGPFTGFRFDLYVPLGAAPLLDRSIALDNRAAGFLELFGRLRPGTSASVAEAELDRLARDPNRMVEAHRSRVFRAAPMTGLDTDLRSGVVLLVALVGCLSILGLGVASLNAGGLLLARGMARQREFALRQALGAGRERLVRLQLLEAGVLVAAATGAAVLVAVAIRGVIRGLVPGLPVSLALRLEFDQRVLVAGGLLAVVATLTTGLLPALATTRADLAARLRAGRLGSPSESRLRQWFLSLQVAVTFALLIGAALLARAIASSRNGGPAAGAPVATLAIDGSFVNLADDRRRDFFEALLARVRSAPGVAHAAYAAQLPFGFGGAQANVQVSGIEAPVGQPGFRVEVNRVSPDWIGTVRVPLSSGRDFAAADGPDRPGVGLINVAMARRFWPGADPLNQLLVANGKPIQVVGVVDDGGFAVPGRPSPPRLYLSIDQAAAPRAILLVSGPITESDVGGMLSRAVSALAPDLPLGAVRTLEANVALAYLPQRLLGGATTVVALLTLLLAAFGLYGLLSFWVTTRQAEIGIRSALGAKPAQIIALAVRQGLAPVGYGVVAGLGLSMGTGLILRRFLLDVSPFDPAAYVGGTLVFAVVAAFACLIPAARAARVNPLVALRSG